MRRLSLFRLAAVLALLMLALPPASARAAEPLGTVCLVGCPEEGAAARALAPSESVPISPVLWLRTSVDLTVAVCGGLDGGCAMGLAPGAGWGLGWAPPGYQRMRQRAPYLPAELLAVDLHVSAVLRQTLRAQALVMLSLGPVTLGPGLELSLPGAGRPVVALALAFGLRSGLGF